jgi:hypothetical protein
MRVSHSCTRAPKSAIEAANESRAQSNEAPVQLVSQLEVMQLYRKIRMRFSFSSLACCLTAAAVCMDMACARTILQGV